MEVPVSEVDRPLPTIFGVDNEHRLLAKRTPRLIFVGLSLLVAIALRLYIAFTPMGSLHADEAVVGLMARHILDGEFPVFFWAQNYGGSGEVFLTAGLFSVTGSSITALRLVPLLLFLGASFLTWRIGKRLFGEPGATFAAMLLLVWPIYLVWKSIQAHGYYGVLLIVSTAALLVAFQIVESPTWQRFAVLGLLIGIGWWASPQVALVAIPIVLWLIAYKDTRRWLGLGWLAVGALVGSAPWWVWNLVNGWASVFDQPDLPPTTYWERIEGLFSHVLPLGLGFRLPNSDRWVIDPWGGWILYGLVLLTFLWLCVRVIRTRNRPMILLVAIALAYPWIYALSAHTWYLTEPRYLMLIFPPICLMIGWGFNRSFVVTLLGLILTLGLTLAGLRVLTAAHSAMAYSVDPHSSDVSPVIEVLEQNDARFVIADYWIAYPISFQSEEEIIATSSGHVRYGPHDELVRSQPDPAFVFYTGDANQQAFERDRAFSHPDYVRVLQTSYTVYLVPPD